MFSKLKLFIIKSVLPRTTHLDKDEGVVVVQTQHENGKWVGMQINIDPFPKKKKYVYEYSSKYLD